MTNLFRIAAVPAVMFASVVAIHRLAPLGVSVSAQSGATASAPKCAPERRAIAHYARGVKGTAKAKKTLVPCITTTGWRTTELGIAITKAGTILLAPAFGAKGSPVGGIRSSDQGKTWSYWETGDADKRRTSLDMDLTIDPATNRLFWMTPGYVSPEMLAQEARVDFSDDDGKTWTRNPGATGMPDLKTGQPTRDHGFMFFGPPPASLKAQMKDYPNVVWGCATHAPQLCSRSLDGGRTFSTPVGLPYPRECDGPHPPLPADVIYNTDFGVRGVVDSQGTAYVSHAPCNRAYIAISSDGGTTWRNSRVADNFVMGHGMIWISIDKADNLHAAWVELESRSLRYAISRDKGATWSAWMDVAAPGVVESALPHIIAGDRGHAVIAYYGSTNGPGAAPFPFARVNNKPNPVYEKQTWNLYVTSTYNALDEKPVFHSTTLNDPKNPVLYGCTPSLEGVVRYKGIFGNGGARGGCQGTVDYFGLFMEPTGTTWVAFPVVCTAGKPIPGNPHCPNTLGGGPNDRIWALLGRVTAK